MHRSVVFDQVRVWCGSGNLRDAKYDKNGQVLMSETNRPRLSLCMIARDNERTIRSAIESALPFVDEVIVVDTGSIDCTPEIAQELGARVEYFPWCDDFAAARNQSLAFATGEWIFWMDTDDTLPKLCGEQLLDALSESLPENVLGLIMQVHCPASNGSEYHSEEDSEPAAMPGEESHESEISTVVDHVKVLRNFHGLRFEGRIHEQILPSIRRAGGQVSWTDAYVIHSGADYSPEGNQKKLKRDLRLLRMDLKDRPRHPFVRFNLGMTLLHQGEYAEALEHLERCIELSVTEESHLRKAYVLLVDSLEHLNRRWDALRRCWEGLGRYPNDPELSFKLGRLLMLDSRWSSAIEAFERIHRAADDERFFASVDPAIKGYKSYANLAVCHSELGEKKEAIEAWRKCLHDAPGFEDAWDGIIDLCQELGDFELLDQVVDELKEKRQALGFVSVSEALLLDNQGKWDEAIQRFEAAISAEESNVFVLNAFARFLNERKEWEKSIPILEKLRDLDPSQPSPYLNLAICLVELDRIAEAVEALHKSLELRPGHKQTLQLLKVCQEEKNQFDSSHETV